MKVIDLLNMKYNKGEMPNHIVINKMHYKYDNNYKTYIDENGDCMIIDFTNNVLNMSVKILEEQQDIDIQRNRKI